MTARTASWIVLRRWYVLLLVLVATGCCFAWRLHNEGTYASQAVLTFLPPGGQQVASKYKTDPTPLTNFAAAVVDQYNEGRPHEPLSTTDAPLYGVGLRQGVQVSLANSGNQWVNVFEQPLVNIQVVGPDEAWVAKRTDLVVSQLIGLAKSEQASSGVPQSEQITAQLQPVSGQVEHVVPGRGTTLIAAAAFALSGLIAGTALSVWTDRAIAFLSRRPPRARPARSSTLSRQPDLSPKGI